MPMKQNGSIRETIYASFATIMIAAATYTAVSCETTETIGTHKTIDAVYNKSTTASTFVDRHGKMIALDATDINALTTRIDRLIFTGNRIIVVDRRGNKLIAFDNNGHYVSSTAAIIGNGHNEYIRLADAAFDKDSKLIYAFCDAPYCVMLLDTDLKLKKKIPLDYSLSDMAMDSKYVYGIRRNKESGSELIAIDKDDLTSNPIVLHTCSNYVNGLGSIGKSITSTDGGILACLPFCNTIYKIRNGTTEQTITIDLGDRWSTDLDKGQDFRQFMKKNERKSWIIQNMACSDSILLFNTNLEQSYVVDISGNSCNAYSFLSDNAIPFVRWTIIPSSGLSKCVAYELSVRSMAQYAEYVETKDPSMTDSKSYQLAKRFKDNKNPVIVIYKIKE